MVLDVAYATRSVLAELGLSDEHVYGILMHGEPRGSGDRDKAIANSYAALNEMWNFSRPGQCYPGDRGCKVPAFHGNNRTFANCYLVHLGDRLTEQKLDAATDPIAEYLYCSSVTPAARVFEHCRMLEQAHCDQRFCRADGPNIRPRQARWFEHGYSDTDGRSALPGFGSRLAYRQSPHGRSSNAWPERDGCIDCRA